jgi:hypothetical protein
MMLLRVHGLAEDAATLPHFVLELLFLRLLLVFLERLLFTYPYSTSKLTELQIVAKEVKNIQYDEQT